MKEKKAALGRSSINALSDAASDYTESEFSEPESSGLPAQQPASQGNPGCTAIVPGVDNKQAPVAPASDEGDTVGGLGTDVDADDEDAILSLKRWAHHVRPSGQSKPKKASQGEPAQPDLVRSRHHASRADAVR